MHLVQRIHSIGKLHVVCFLPGNIPSLMVRAHSHWSLCFVFPALEIKWIEGSNLVPGRNCNKICGVLGYYCKNDVEWPHTKEQMQIIAHENNIQCDSFCYRGDFSNAPVVVAEGGEAKCSYATGTTVGRQCIFGNRWPGQNLPPRCDRKFSGRTRICPCSETMTTATARE